MQRLFASATLSLSLVLSTIDGSRAQDSSAPDSSASLPPLEVTTTPPRPRQTQPQPSPASRSTTRPSVLVRPIGTPGSLTVPSVNQQRQTLNQIVGAVGFVDAETVANRYTNNLRDVLKDTPGVFVQERYGQELRLSVRGSAIARGFHLRGVEVLQDGIPVNFADGSGDLYQIDPLALRSVEVYKGGNGLTYGSTYLGGAINFVTPTAHTAIAPNILRAETGSFDTFRLSGQASRIWGNADALINATSSHSDGYRNHARQQYEQFNANFGYRLNPNVETRFYLGVYNVDQLLPGALSLNDALNNPTMATAAAWTGNQSRKVRVERIANRTTFSLETGRLDLDTWLVHKNLYHPIFQVIDQDGLAYGIAPRYTGNLTINGFRNDVIAGARFFGGNNLARQYVNVGGFEGTQTVNARQDAYNYEAYAENRFFFLPAVALMTGAKIFRAERKYTNYGGYSSAPTPFSDSRTYEGINPKIGLLWEPNPDIQVFADVTRSRDVPDFSDLTQTSATTTRFVPLEAQSAWTGEIGSRGRYGRFAWDVTAYRSQVQNELLQYVTSSSIPATTFNAPRTIHQGIEFGASAEIFRNVLGPQTGDTITVSQLWNYSDFRFDNDPQYGNNRIAGTPEHVLRTVVSYNHPNGFYFAPSVDWVPTGAWADYANTLRAPGYTLLGLQTGIKMPNDVLLFVDARNLTDQRYISDISTVTDARLVATSIFYPGTGRAVYAGVRFKM